VRVNGIRAAFELRTERQINVDLSFDKEWDQ